MAAFKARAKTAGFNGVGQLIEEIENNV